MGFKSSFLDMIFVLEYGAVRLFLRKMNMEATSMGWLLASQTHRMKELKELLCAPGSVTGQRRETLTKLTKLRGLKKC